jgi:hypothetical protein
MNSGYTPGWYQDLYYAAHPDEKPATAEPAATATNDVK